jgi:hypothetical protein
MRSVHLIAWRLGRWVLSMLVRYQLWSERRYLADAVRTGIHGSLDLNAFQAKCDSLAIRLIDLQPPSHYSAARAKGARQPQETEPETAGAVTDGAGTEQRVRA